jgi:hypothetical protein
MVAAAVALFFLSKRVTCTESSCMGETDRYITFKCCACGVETDLSKKEEPSLNRDIPSKEQWLKKRKKAKARRAQLVTPPIVTHGHFETWT